MPIKSENTQESLLELMVSESVTEGVYWAVEIAQPI